MDKVDKIYHLIFSVEGSEGLISDEGVVTIVVLAIEEAWHEAVVVLENIG